MADKDMHSTGRGGAGNIGKGEGEYADSALLTEEKPSKTSKEELSTGRGGSGNIVHDPKTGTVAGASSVPATTEHPVEDHGASYADYHTGRGGEGNIHRDKYDGHSKPQKEHQHGGEHHGVLDKVKHAVGMDKK